jgi:hypothetical protein
MSGSAIAAERAAALVGEVRDDPAARLALCSRVYDDRARGSGRHHRFGRAALSFMRWQVNRGVLAAIDAEIPGSAWWRAVNERLLLDGCEMVARGGGFGGPSSSPTIAVWMQFFGHPSVAGALCAAGRRAGRPAARDGRCVSLAVRVYVTAENNLGRLLDYGVILPRLQRLYDWSAEELEQPGLKDLVHDGIPSYLAPSEAIPVWRLNPAPPLARVLARVTGARSSARAIP